jgi:hypothetical protein
MGEERDASSIIVTGFYPLEFEQYGRDRCLRAKVESSGLSPFIIVNRVVPTPAICS